MIYVYVLNQQMLHNIEIVHNLINFLARENSCVTVQKENEST
jgi:hypothetical protein